MTQRQEYVALLERGIKLLKALNACGCKTECDGCKANRRELTAVAKRVEQMEAVLVD